MANTTNFNWETPDDTDLVKDGAAAMRTLGNSIDTSFVDLKGGTTGQILSKASNTDLDYTWVTTDDANAIQNAIVDAKGDLIAATAADTPARLAVVTNGQVLTADSTAATGLAWATPSGGGTWTSWTPTWTNLTVGNGTVTARYLKVGGLVNFKIQLIFGSTTSVTGRISSTWPVTPSSGNSAQSAAVIVQFEDAGVAPVYGAFFNAGATTSGFEILAINTSGTYAAAAVLSSTVPITWATGDYITISGSYEVTP